MTPGDLELSPTVDGTVRQNVPIPPQATNSVLSGMISSAKRGKGGAASSSLSPTDPSSSSSSSSSYAPSSPLLPSCMQFEKSSHPTACLFHVLFKSLAFITYMLGPRAMEDVATTVTCVLILAADFWVVKNVTGRLLVGLRWWNMVDMETGETRWIFESASPMVTTGGGPTSSLSGVRANNNTFDSRFFWWVLYLTPVVWSVLFLSAALWLKFQCLVTLTCALVLSASNVYGYYQCSADQRRRWNEWMNVGSAAMGAGAVMGNPMMSVLGRLFGGSGGRRQRIPQQDPNIMAGTFA
ncbi:hypothetical protein ACHAXA_010331 [Cyclostephanos tholiformis]|uniref:Golgi apparatus membrane protein TVP23 homolog n=1 Tax=Cyclostephanos tholiformis TaxID=382380 RepID=A0ABD3RF48_9STRA